MIKRCSELIAGDLIYQNGFYYLVVQADEGGVFVLTEFIEIVQLIGGLFSVYAHRVSRGGGL